MDSDGYFCNVYYGSEVENKNRNHRNIDTIKFKIPPNGPIAGMAAANSRMCSLVSLRLDLHFYAFVVKNTLALLANLT